MSQAIKPLHPAMRFVGTAVTVETDGGDNLPIHLATYAIPEPGYVMVIDGGNNTERAYVGDLITAAARATGYAAIVTNSLVRDRNGLVELNFPVFSAGVTPRGPIKKNEGVVNGKIRCGGLEVSPGDLVVGDCDGVTIIARGHVEEILRAAEEKQKYEEERRETIEEYRLAVANGLERPDIRPNWLKTMLPVPPAARAAEREKK
jgi:regulator of RNase E activity RraA